jgi:hypothetical protein
VPRASTSGCSPDHRGHGGRTFRGLSGYQPGDEIRPPTALDSRCPDRPIGRVFGVVVGHLEAGPVVAGRVDQTRDMARRGQHELGVAAQLGAAVAALPGGTWSAMPAIGSVPRTRARRATNVGRVASDIAICSPAMPGLHLRTFDKAPSTSSAPRGAAWSAGSLVVVVSWSVVVVMSLVSRSFRLGGLGHVDLPLEELSGGPLRQRIEGRHVTGILVGRDPLLHE